jgi:DNA recombination-dependent growth factor C
MKSVINFFRNLFSPKKEQEVKIETIDPISYPGTIDPCGCDDCQCGKKTYVIPVGAITPEEAEKSLQETIASFKEEVIILPEEEIKLEVKEEVKEVKAKKPRKPYKKKDSNNSSKGKGKKKNSETSKK